MPAAWLGKAPARAGNRRCTTAEKAQNLMKLTGLGSEVSMVNG